MSTAVLTAVARAYENGARHIGHKSGSGVASGVFARCHRMAGYRVLMVSGTDEPQGLPEVDAPFASGESVVSIQLPSNAATAQPRLTRPDVQAAVTVVGRRDTARDIRPIDLTGADLTDVRWPEGMPVPEGWLVDDKSSGLQLADELSEVTAHYL